MASERFQRHVERLLEEADDAISRYDWEAVRQAAQAVLAIDPENSDGLTFLATAEQAMGGSPSPQTSEPTPAPTSTAAVDPHQSGSPSHGPVGLPPSHRHCV